ncbi:hypothetical protein [Sphingomonas montanisoli]|uniref:Uncharacterized protein n=1 Tax=Sphingomonas montanisoli TaxID=2606412 RepID=A0A5D9C6K2_9SPHN|nr:hypothetical protein [Sphingomonas montanisoli]TZG25631.1 hypothetical protein FYJ91_11435 [Sphingomonas montanisoli]
MTPDNTPASPSRWAWWAGRDEEEYRLAGPCPTRGHAINEAYGDTEPGDIIYLVEAITAPEEERDHDSGIIPFVKMRKRSHVIRKKEARND